MPPDTSTSPPTSPLNTRIIGPTEINQLIRELETLSNALDHGQSSPSALPRASRSLNDFFLLYHRNLLVAQDRKIIFDVLKTIKSQAPVLHISFATSPTPLFMNKLLEWLRHNIHPLVLVKVGLDPSIAVGCIVRTNNRQFDFTLRHRFDSNREQLLDRLTGQT